MLRHSLVLVAGLGLAAVLFLPPAPAVHAEDPESTGAEAIDALIRGLGADTAKEREEAHKRLVTIGEAARAALEEAARTAPLETKRRARALLEHLDVVADARSGDDLIWAGLRGGPRRSGVAGGQLPATKPKLAWSVSVPSRVLMEGGVVPAGERVFCLDGSGLVRAHAAADGQRLWLHRLEAEKEQETRITASAVIAAGRLVVPTSRGMVALDEATGRPSWAIQSPYGSYATPAVDGGRVYGSFRNLGIKGIDLETGEELFDHKMAPKGALLVSGDVVISGTVDGRLLRISPETGKVVWERELGSAPQMGPTLATPGIVVVFVNNRYLKGLDVETGEELWSRRMLARSKSESLAAAYGRVCVPGEDGQFYVMDATSGRMIWKRDSGMTSLGAPCVTKDRVVYGANARITCRDADSGDWIWRMNVPARSNATPAAWGGRLFILFDRELRAYDAR